MGVSSEDYRAAVERIAELEAALRPFAEAAALIPRGAMVMRARVSDDLDYSITGDHLHNAKAALTKSAD